MDQQAIGDWGVVGLDDPPARAVATGPEVERVAASSRADIRRPPEPTIPLEFPCRGRIFPTHHALGAFRFRLVV